MRAAGQTFHKSCFTCQVKSPHVNWTTFQNALSNSSHAHCSPCQFLTQSKTSNPNFIHQKRINCDNFLIYCRFAFNCDTFATDLQQASGQLNALWEGGTDLLSELLRQEILFIFYFFIYLSAVISYFFRQKLWAEGCWLWHHGQYWGELKCLPGTPTPISNPRKWDRLPKISMCCLLEYLRNIFLQTGTCYCMIVIEKHSS